MKLTTLVLGALVVLFAAVAQAAGPVAVRTLHPKERIARGAADGSLTGGEVRALRAEQRAIRDLRHAALVDDGRLGPAEAARLGRARARASRDIYRLRHNPWERWSR